MDAMDIDGPPPPPAQQRAEMLACDPAGSLVAGTHYYLVEQKWFNTWTDFSTAVENAEPPGPSSSYLIERGKRQRRRR